MCAHMSVHTHAGQAVVQLVEDRAQGLEFAMKFYLSRAAFELEKSLYLDAAQPLGRYLPAMRCIVDSPHEGFVDATGIPMPPCIVMERGESLPVWAAKHPAGVDLPSALHVRPSATLTRTACLAVLYAAPAPASFAVLQL
jgi:hypothetical protein